MKTRPLSLFPLLITVCHLQPRFNRNKSPLWSLPSNSIVTFSFFLFFKPSFFKFSFICLDLYIAFVLVYFLFWKENLLCTHNSYLSERYPYTPFAKSQRFCYRVIPRNFLNALIWFSILFLRLVIDRCTANITFHTLKNKTALEVDTKITHSQNSHSQTKKT